VAAVARGVLQHHHDDAWFHRTPAFAELSWSFTVAIRDTLAPDDGLRPSFLGHILVELLLDAALIAEATEELEKYYAALSSIDAGVIQTTVNRAAPRQTERLAPLIPAFVASRFLFDYLDDERLLYRLNGVMARVQLPPLPKSFLALLPAARRRVHEAKERLLAE
jgi:hypothetical protein